jgi:hypothetical protein
VETGCQGGQGSPRAVAPGGWMDGFWLRIAACSAGVILLGNKGPNYHAARAKYSTSQNY